MTVTIPLWAYYAGVVALVAVTALVAASVFAVSAIAFTNWLARRGKPWNW